MFTVWIARRVLSLNNHACQLGDSQPSEFPRDCRSCSWSFTAPAIGSQRDAAASMFFSFNGNTPFHSFRSWSFPTCRSISSLSQRHFSAGQIGNYVHFLGGLQPRLLLREFVFSFSLCASPFRAHTRTAGSAQSSIGFEEWTRPTIFFRHSTPRSGFFLSIFMPVISAAFSWAGQ